MFDISRPSARARGHGVPVLFVGYGGSPTGYARVIHSVLQHLPEGYEVHHFAPDLRRQPLPVGWEIYANGPEGNVYDNTQLDRVIASVRPRLIVLLDEPWMWLRREPSVGKFPCIFYAAIDSRKAFPPELASTMARLRAFVVFTEFARQIAERSFADAGVAAPPICVIPHGVDRALFFPIASTFEESRREARRRMFPTCRELDDAFIVLNANRNQPWKRIDLTIEGFALFARNKPASVKLWLHMSTRKPRPGSIPLVDYFGIRDRLLTTITSEEHPHVSSVTLNTIYNTCEVGLNTSEKEAWGLIAFEHAASGAAQIVPRHSACEELWYDSAELIEVPLTAERVAEALERLYSNPELRHQRALEASQNAYRPELDWRAVTNRWDALIRSVLDS